MKKISAASKLENWFFPIFFGVCFFAVLLRFVVLGFGGQGRECLEGLFAATHVCAGLDLWGGLPGDKLIWLSRFLSLATHGAGGGSSIGISVWVLCAFRLLLPAGIPAFAGLFVAGFLPFAVFCAVVWSIGLKLFDKQAAMWGCVLFAVLPAVLRRWVCFGEHMWVGICVLLAFYVVFACVSLGRLALGALCALCVLLGFCVAGGFGVCMLALCVVVLFRVWLKDFAVFSRSVAVCGFVVLVFAGLRLLGFDAHSAGMGNVLDFFAGTQAGSGGCAGGVGDAGPYLFRFFVAYPLDFFVNGVGLFLLLAPFTVYFFAKGQGRRLWVGRSVFDVVLPGVVFYVLVCVKPCVLPGVVLGFCSVFALFAGAYLSSAVAWAAAFRYFVVGGGVLLYVFFSVTGFGGAGATAGAVKRLVFEPGCYNTGVQAMRSCFAVLDQNMKDGFGLRRVVLLDADSASAANGFEDIDSGTFEALLAYGLAQGVEFDSFGAATEGFLRALEKTDLLIIVSTNPVDSVHSYVLERSGTTTPAGVFESVFSARMQGRYGRLGRVEIFKRT